MYVYASATITQNIEWKEKKKRKEENESISNVCERMITISIEDN